ncbi:hypothetical protein C6Y14_21215 [Streptomyces dioscori]|uniref:Uncharacterized protein n=1 Tax=Streptomyces dioscori TaxID=2109333 RepID=A0A2P8Q4Y5_9ACTN|nr:hypothetical protein C6Y14_21215 [Streptomyces dioscori]
MLSGCRAQSRVLDVLGSVLGAARVRAGRRDAAEIHQKPPRGAAVALVSAAAGRDFASTGPQARLQSS